LFTREWFFDLERRLKDAGLDSDSQSFDQIKSILQNPKKLSPDEFASAAIYVILAGGFSQKTAKKIHHKIMCSLQSAECNYDDLFNLFRNKNKVGAIVKIWNDKNALCTSYFGIDDFIDKILFLQKLPHIGKITANHLARNLGENVVKYDIWIQRLGCVFALQKQGIGHKAYGVLSQKINNGALDDDVKIACDAMFAHLENETGLPRGYIDVVLWKACQTGMISFK
jgi:hypothetical protein